MTEGNLIRRSNPLWIGDCFVEVLHYRSALFLTMTLNESFLNY